MNASAVQCTRSTRPRSIGIPHSLTRLSRLAPCFEMLSDLERQVVEEAARQRAIPGYATPATETTRGQSA